MRKFLSFCFLLLIINSLHSCWAAKAMKGEEIPVDIVFEKWNIEFGTVKAIAFTLKGKRNSGDAVEVQTKVGINQYDEYLLPMLTKLEKEDQLKDGNTGSGIIQINQKSGTGKLVINKVGNIATQNMEFRLDPEAVFVFMP